MTEWDLRPVFNLALVFYLGVGVRRQNASLLPCRLLPSGLSLNELSGLGWFVSVDDLGCDSATMALFELMFQMPIADTINRLLSPLNLAVVDKTAVRFQSGMTRYANWSVFDTHQPLPYDAEWIERRPTDGQCAVPLGAMQVYSNGNVSFCSCADFNGDGELYLGNINEQSLKQMLQSERARQLWDWEGSGVPEFCQSCSMYQPLSIFSGHPEAITDPLGVFNGYR